MDSTASGHSDRAAAHRPVREHVVVPPADRERMRLRRPPRALEQSTNAPESIVPDVLTDPGEQRCERLKGPDWAGLVDSYVQRRPAANFREGEDALRAKRSDLALERDPAVGLERGEARARLPRLAEGLLTEAESRPRPGRSSRLLGHRLDARVGLVRIAVEVKEVAEDVLHRPRDRDGGVDPAHRVLLVRAPGSGAPRTLGPDRAPRHREFSPCH